MIRKSYKSARKKISIKSELIGNTENMINQQFNHSSGTHKPFHKYAFIAVPVCLALVLSFFVAIPLIFKNTHALNGSRSNGTIMFSYYRYNGNYYSLKGASPNIQKNILKRLYGDFYEIKGVDTSKSIALFSNKYYQLLTYAFNDTITFQGKPYLMNANFSNTPGEYLGNVGQYKIYELPGSEISDEILVKIENHYCIAYQYLSSVEFMGETYELEPEKHKINDNNYVEQYIDMAGPYKAYKYDNNDNTKPIMLHINDSEEVKANATTTSHKGKPLPVSNYGSAMESIYPVLATVQWKTHGIYQIGSGENTQESLKSQLGKQIDNYTYDGYSYALYEMKGADTSKSIIVKNNRAYFKYDFIFTDTITFNDHAYIIGDDKEHNVKGNQIGLAGSYKVYEIKGIDSSKTIDLVMSGSTESGTLEGDFTAFRQAN